MGFFVMATKKKPRFFCDHCGTEVGAHDKRCPKCGHIFESVRCPQCGYTGGEEQFKNGCPRCGYSALPAGQSQDNTRPAKRDAPDDAPLPAWLYVLVAGIVAGALALLLWFVKH
jgi:uncharacterized membrane protein YvbJ